MSEQDTRPASGLGLSEAIGLLRDELLRARAAGAESEIQLPVESMTVQLQVAATRTGEPVERCHAVGYPWFAENRSRTAVRDSVDAIGVIPVLSKLAAGLLSMQVTVAPRELPPHQTALGASAWSGMSGAPTTAPYLRWGRWPAER